MDPNFLAPGAGLDGSFTAGNPYTAPRKPSTAVTAKFLESLRLEVKNVLAAAGIDPSPYDDTQLLAAFRALYALGIPAPQSSQLYSQGANQGIFESVGGFRGLPGCPMVGSWSCGNAVSAPPSPFYEEASGEWYNAPGPQTNTGGVGVRTLDARTADHGIWIPQDWFPPDGILLLDFWGQIKQADTGGARTFYLCLDPNGDAANKANAWGSADAVVLLTSIATNAYPNLVPCRWQVAIVSTDIDNQLYLSKLEIFNKNIVSGKRVTSSAQDVRVWGLDLLSHTGWNFTRPLSGAAATSAKHLDWGGNTLLGTRWAVSGTQANSARLIINSIDAKVAANPWG